MTDRQQDLEDLHALGVRYAQYVDQRRGDELGDVFAADAVWDGSATGFGRHVGRDAIIAFMRRGAEHTAASMHCVANQLIEHIDGDDAVGSHALFGERRLHDGAVHQFRSLARDRYVRTTDGWRIRERVVTPLMGGDAVL